MEIKEMNRTELAFTYCKKIIVSGTKNIVPREVDLRTRLLVLLSRELLLSGYIMSERLLLRIGEREIIDALQNLPPLESWRQARGLGRLGRDSEVVSEEYIKSWSVTSGFSGEFSEHIHTTRWYAGLDLCDYNTIDLMTETDFMMIPYKITSSAMIKNSVDVEVFEWFLKEYTNVMLPDVVKNNFLLVSCIVPKYSSWTGLCINDFLKYGLWLSDGDYNLGKNWKIGKISRLVRKGILMRMTNYLERKNLDEELVVASEYTSHWIALGRKLHPGDYTSRFPKAVLFFRRIMNYKDESKPKTWESRLQSLYRLGSVSSIVEYILSTKPTELGKWIDSLLRLGIKKGTEGELVDALIDTTAIGRKDILRLMMYYDFRESILVPKFPVRLKPIGTGTSEAIQDILYQKLVTGLKPNLKLSGKTVYMDEKLRYKSLPNQDGDTWGVFPRISETKITEDGVVRFFYTNSESRGSGGNLFLIRFWSASGEIELRSVTSTEGMCFRKIESLKGTETGIVDINIRDILQKYEDIKYLTVSLSFSFSEVSIGWFPVTSSTGRYEIMPPQKSGMVDFKSNNLFMIDLEKMRIIEFGEYDINEFEGPEFLNLYKNSTEFMMLGREIKYNLYDFLEYYYLKSGVAKITTSEKDPADVRCFAKLGIGRAVLDIIGE